VQYAASLGEQHSSGIGQGDASLLQQANAKRLLQLANLLADRWLGDMHPLGSPAELQLLGNCHEICEMPKLHALPFVCSRQACASRDEIASEEALVVP
jgi:hypothetical protein